MNYTISRRIYTAVTLLAYAYFVIWLGVENRRDLALMPEIILCLIFSPILLGCASACGLVAAALFAVVTQIGKPPPALQSDLSKPDKGINPVIVSLSVAGSFAATTMLAFANPKHSLGGDGLYIVWFLSFLVGTLLMEFIFPALLKLINRQHFNRIGVRKLEITR